MESTALYFPDLSHAMQKWQHATIFFMPSRSAEFMRPSRFSGEFSCKAQTYLHEGLQKIPLRAWKCSV